MQSIDHSHSFINVMHRFIPSTFLLIGMFCAVTGSWATQLPGTEAAGGWSAAASGEPQPTGASGSLVNDDDAEDTPDSDDVPFGTGYEERMRRAANRITPSASGSGRTSNSGSTGTSHGGAAGGGRGGGGGGGGGR